MLMTDIARRFPQNPILRPAGIRPSTPGMRIECLLNPGVFRFEGKIWLLLRVAERPEQKPGKTTFPVLTREGNLEILEFDNSDPRLDLSDPRVISYAGQDYLTTMSHLRLVSSDDGIHFREAPAQSISGRGNWNRSALRIAGWSGSAIPITSPIPRSRSMAWGWGCGARATGARFVRRA